MKQAIAIILAVLLAFAGGVLTISAVDVGLDVAVEQISINAAGDNSKAMQKANDSEKRIDSVRHKWIGLSCAAAVSYLLSLAIIVALIIKNKKSKNVRE
ncbi:MAG: hypothetical protein IJI47_00320 [Eubacterium sp.]|nr:hypothetical protein [Eubacterium sp.]